MYKRVLLKISGEQLSGEHGSGIDPKVAAWIAAEVKKVVDAKIELVIVVGGGNMVRGAQVAGNGIKRVTADQMGMLSGLINAMALTDIFESQGVPTRCLSNVYAEQVAENFSFRLAEKHLANKRVVIVAGGTGRPYSTHDSAAVLVALELGCEIVLKSTKVDGIYDKDPNKFTDAVKYSTLNYQQAVENADIKVMDKAALGLAMEQNMPVVVFDLAKDGNILKAASGEAVGTKVS
jgi:uridylate kinase